jgi:EAL domain-containing protein (putative c-di-GMP-specific phosphodiesterase class I)
VVLPAVSQEEDIAVIAQKLLDALAEQFPFSGHNLFTSASLGIALAPEDGEDVATLIKHADMAMYKAKDQGRNGFRFYSAEMNVKAMERMILESGLRRALERDEFFLCYQPQLDLRSNTLVGMEALLRWKHPDLGLLAPNSFIPLAEETGLIVPIGEWVLRTACRQNKAWQDAGFPCLKVAVNLSARQFRQQNLLQVVLQALQESGLSPEWLELELTESTIMTNPDEALEVLRHLKALGITLAIDDFGTGYSSLSYLKLFPIDSLKIDRTFIRDLTTNRNDAAIAEAIISMAHKLDLKVIAEGVELEAQQGFLVGSRCNMLQGYYFSYPLTVDDFSAFLANQTSVTLPPVVAVDPPIDA